MNNTDYLESAFREALAEFKKHAHLAESGQGTILDEHAASGVWAIARAIWWFARTNQETDKGLFERLEGIRKHWNVAFEEEHAG